MIHPTPTLVSLYEKNIVSWAHYTAVKFNYKPKIKRFFMALILLSARPAGESVEQWRGLILIWNCIWRDGLIARSSYVNPIWCYLVEYRPVGADEAPLDHLLLAVRVSHGVADMEQLTVIGHVRVVAVHPALSIKGFEYEFDDVISIVCS